MSNQLLFVVIAVAIGAAYFIFMRAGTISGEQARQLVADGARLIDVRSQGEFSSGHIDGAVNIPVHNLAGRIAELGDKDAPIVVYCLSGTRSRRAKSMLETGGYTSVHNLGGMSRW